MRNNSVYFHIKCDREDCFANDPERHECTILKNTKFKNGVCSFHKPKKGPRKGTKYGCIECKVTDCFANDDKNNKCMILNNTDFGERKCPFKKSKYEFFRKKEESR